ncbi:MAG: macro domain-containing protein [Chloroflexi bacterium]|nr:MAG: macro domain-containing protein [Chloroflexota bacterium]
MRVTTIRLLRADIAKLDVDAVVNAANDRLWMGSGVAGALKRAGGEEIEREALAQAPIPIGEAVVTTAGRLPARHVIHAAAMGQDLTTDETKIARATENALRRADELRLRSIAFPALGTGVGGFPLGDCARIMIDAVRRHLERGGTLDEVVFALRSEDALRVFESALGGVVRVVG